MWGWSGNRIVPDSAQALRSFWISASAISNTAVDHALFRQRPRVLPRETGLAELWRDADATVVEYRFAAVPGQKAEVSLARA